MSAPAVCSICSEELEEGIRFCTSCGTPIDDATPEPEPAPVAEPAPTMSVAGPQITAPVVVATAPIRLDDDVLIRRTRRSPLLPPRETVGDDEDVVISRSWATATRNRNAPNQVGKSRKIAGDLPAWEPLPPGESIVSRKAVT